MTRIICPRGWRVPERTATPESVYLDRRSFLKTLGVGGAGALAVLAGCGDAVVTPESPPTRPRVDRPRLTGVTRNAGFGVEPARSLTPYRTAISFNNYYEFTTERDRVWRLAENVVTEPWSVAIAGLTRRPRTVDLDDIMRIAPLEERIYRFRCVEAWAMTVPWIGIPLADFIRWCEPASAATHVRFVSAHDPATMPNNEFVWPYYEGLRLDEATHELAFLAVGLYGRVLPTQNGAPLRIVMPWKYGYKSTKAIARVEFVDGEPPTFWNDIDAENYTFFSNVDPSVPHTFWSQEEETLLGTRDVVPTLPFNGYGAWVAGLYG